MERYILDTCTWIEYFHERYGVKERVDDKDIDQIFVSSHSVPMTSNEIAKAIPVVFVVSVIVNNTSS